MLINWNHQGKIVSLSINLPDLSRTHYLGEDSYRLGSIHPQGVYCNPGLDKKEYIALIKQYHPDVSGIDPNLSTQIAQGINAAKDSRSASLQFDCRSVPRKPVVSNLEMEAIMDRLGAEGYGWAIERYGRSGWTAGAMYDMGGNGRCYSYEKTCHFGGVEVLVDVMILDDIVCPPTESVHSLSRDAFFLRHFNWEALTVKEIRSILQNEKQGLLSKLKKPDLVRCAKSYFSDSSNQFRPYAWRITIYRDLSSLLPGFWNDMESVRQRSQKEQHKADMDKLHAPKDALIAWMKESGKGRIPHYKFRRVIDHARAHSDMDNPHEWGSSIWEAAWQFVIGEAHPQASDTPL